MNNGGFMIMDFHEDVKDVIATLNDLYCDCINQYGGTSEGNAYEEAVDEASNVLELLGNIRLRIKKLKKAQMLSLLKQEGNKDYLTGYICALSVVEGMLNGET